MTPLLHVLPAAVGRLPRSERARSRASRLRRLLCLLAVLPVVGQLLLLATPARAQAPGPGSSGEPGTPAGATVEVLQLSGPIDPPVLSALRDLVEGANRRGSALVVIQLDTPGGVSVDPAEVVATIRRSAVPVAMWVGPGTAHAAGAGLLLTSAAQLPAASSVARLGPLCPTSVGRGCPAEDTALLAELWTAHGVDPARAQETAALLSGSQVEPAALPAGSAKPSLLVVESLPPLLVDLDGRVVTTADGPHTLRLRQDEVTVRFHTLGLWRRVLHATLNPTLVYLLLVGVLLLALFEVFQPGFGVAGVAALLLTPLALYGLAVLPTRWWALALLVAGVLALALDLAVAGLGVPTAAGALAMAAGSWWLFPRDSSFLGLPAWVVAAVVAAAVIYFVLVMTVVLRAQAGPAAAGEATEVAGKVGVVRSALNPEGHVFVGGALWRARWTGAERGRIRAGTPVRVLALDPDGVLLVEGTGGEDAAGRSQGEIASTGG